MTIEQIKAELGGLKDELVRSFKADIIDLVDKKFNDVTNFLESELSVIHTRIEDVEKVLPSNTPKTPLEDVDHCIIISGLNYSKDEVLEEKVTTLMEVMGVKPRVAACRRLGRLDKEKPLVKVAVHDELEKIVVLRAKRKLLDDDRFARVYIRSSKPHTERQLENNLKTLLRLIPNGADYIVNAQGKIIPKK